MYLMLKNIQEKIWKRVSAGCMFVLNRSTMWTRPLSMVDEEEVLCNTC